MTFDRKKKKILQITREKFPPEIRVVKEAVSLAQGGYRSAVLCPPYDDQSEYEVWNNIEIFRPNQLKKRSMIDKFLAEAFFFSPNWYKAIDHVIKEYAPDVLHVHDIWLGRTAFKAQTNEKIVFDLHENMPAAVVEYIKGYQGPQRWFRQVFHTYKRIFKYERKLLERCQLVLAVVEEARQRIIIDHPRLDSKKILNIENLESKRFVKNSVSGNACFKKDHFSVLYIGGFGPHRGIDTLIHAMKYVKSSNRKIRLQLIGARPSQYLDMLKILISDLGIANHVQINGWVETEDVLANIQQADVCCVPHHSNSHTDTTIPHKLFQYMIAKRPILVSSSTPLARSVKQANAGMIFIAGDPQDCSKKIMAMADDPASLNKFAENGYRYVVEDGNNWEEKSAYQLIQAYDRLLNNVTAN